MEHELRKCRGLRFSSNFHSWQLGIKHGGFDIYVCQGKLSNIIFLISIIESKIV